MLQCRKMDKDNKEKDEFNRCMDEREPKSCSSIDVIGNNKGFFKLKLKVVVVNHDTRY